MSTNIFDYISVLDSNVPCCEPLFKTKIIIPPASVDLLFSIVSSLNLHDNTKYLAFHILNRITSQNPPNSIIIISIFHASKMNDIDPLKFSQISLLYNIGKNEFYQLEK